MKSVIAQGSTIVKAVEEALKKAGQPTEFFVKLLENAQSGFLGFGAKKAKIALFFKQNPHHYKNDGLLSQDSYQDLFENNLIHKQIEQQLKDVGAAKQQTSAPKTQPQKQQHKQSQTMQQRPQSKQPASQTSKHPQQKNNALSQPKPEQKNNQQSQRPHKNLEQRKSQEQHKNQRLAPVKEKTDPSKLMVRPLPPKNNDSSKS
ncbi:Jag N-terminal domain-containing protein [Candidatus Babeliales bacterium]|nr:Jag N-terminal domain-containing protein [Candidatus Babeliales bacterium]